MNQNKNLINILIWGGIFVLLLLLVNFLQGDSFSSNRQNMPFSDFLSKVNEKQVVVVKISGRSIDGQLADGTLFSSYAGDYYGLVDKLQDAGVAFDIVPPDSKMNALTSILASTFPMLILVGLWIFFMRQMGGGAGKAMGFGKSKAKLLSDKGTKVTFKDVAGIEESKAELTEIVDFLRDPSRFHKLGGRIPKGCLLIGPPGTGKTLLAKAIAGEANVPFFSISGSDFVEMFVGVGASRVRDMFEQGKRNAPCIIFIDEIDAVGRHRGVGLGGGNDEREQTLNQLLVEMDGFEANEGVVIIAATNRPDVLDKALLRPGRFDRQIAVANPDINGRHQILTVHAKKIKHADNIDLKAIARGTPGFSGASLASLINEAALIAARRNKRVVDMSDLDEARDKIVMGVERRSTALSEKELRNTAFHEAGHAIVSLYVKSSHPIYKATIIPRGHALGFVMRLPENDEFSKTRESMESDIAVAMGGRVAEELTFGHDKVTSGAKGDIVQATNMARAMVTEWGMSDKIGNVYYDLSADVAYGSKMNSHTVSESMVQLVDSEVKLFIDEGYQLAKKILLKKFDELHIVANALLDYETLTGQQIKNLVAGKEVNFDGEVILDSMFDEQASGASSSNEKKRTKKNSTNSQS